MAKLLNDDREKPIYSSTRFSDVLIYAEVKDFLRVLFDDEKKLFIYCDGWDYIHIFLGKAALDYGLYPQDMSSKLSKNLGLFEFAISKDYQERLLEQDSYSKATEYNGFYIYTRDGSGLLKNSVFRDIVKPYKKSKEITIEERIRRLEKKLNETIIDAKSVGDELMNIILKNPTRRELRDNDMNICRGAMGRSGNFYFISLSQLAHCDLFDTLEKLGIDDAPYNTFKYSNNTNTFFYYDPDNDLDYDLIKQELNKSPYFKNFAGCTFEPFDDPDYDPELYEGYNPLNESEDLTKFNRIAGFYHTDTKEFELFPRTAEEISTEDDEINDYIHNVHSKDEFTEFNIVRFGIEDIPGEGVVCYIEGDTKRNVEKCYYAILKKYAEECNIIKYELEYYVGNEHKYIFLDRYGKQLMESIIHAKSNGDNLTNVVLKNPTRKELEENNIERARCIEDSEGNWYFADMFDTLHFQIENLLRNNISFPYYDGNDSYGISYFDVEGNEFWYNSNEMMPKEKCLEQYYKSSYLKKEFPDAYIRENPYGFNSDDYENENIELDESINLHKNNRVAGFFYYKDNKWELLPRTEEILDMDDDWDKYLKFQHNAPEGWLEEVGAIRFSIETHDDDKTLCVIESPKELWVKPFIKKLYNKFPEEMSMVDLFDVEYQDIYDQTHWNQFSPMDLD